MLKNQVEFYQKIGAYGVYGDRLRRLQDDLDPLFTLATGPTWAEGTDCGYGDDSLYRFGGLRTCPEKLDCPSVEEIAERYHDATSAVIGDRHMVELGSLIGSALLDKLFQDLGPQGIAWYTTIQYLALYRVAAAVAGLESEAASISGLIQDLLSDEVIWNDIEDDAVYDGFSVDQAAA